MGALDISSNRRRWAAEVPLAAPTRRMRSQEQTRAGNRPERGTDPSGEQTRVGNRPEASAVDVGTGCVTDGRVTLAADRSCMAAGARPHPRPLGSVLPPGPAVPG